MISKTLKNKLLEQGMQPQDISKITELTYEQFKDKILDTVDELQQQANTYCQLVDMVDKKQNSSYFKYYMLPTGQVGYINLGKKSMGYLK